MRIDERVAKNGVTILDVHGRITLGEGSVELRNRVRDHVVAGRKNLILNMADVSYVDSTGILGLVTCYTEVSNSCGQLKLLKLTEKVQDLLAITRLLTVFESYEDEHKAVASFR